MEKKIFNSAELSKAGPYSHAVEGCGLIFFSGQIPVDAATGEKILDDVKAATALVFENAKKALAAAGSSLDKVIKTTVFLRDMSYFAEMNEVYASYFPENPPARSCVAAKELPLGVPVEIEMIALR